MHNSEKSVTAVAIWKSYRDSAGKVSVLEDIDLSVRKGEFVTVLGPNGVGKTTLAKLLAGIIAPERGHIVVEGRSAVQACAERQVGYVPQDYRASLLPWRTTLDNVTLPLELTGASPPERKAAVAELVSKGDIGLSEDELGSKSRKRFPYQLSGGQQQRVALARNLIYKPRLLVMDEPFSALDLVSRPRMQDALLRIWRSTGMTVVFVSHEIEEALYLGDKIIVLHSRPARELHVFNNPLPRPRSRDMVVSPKAVSLRRQIEGLFIAGYQVME